MGRLSLPRPLHDHLPDSCAQAPPLPLGVLLPEHHSSVFLSGLLWDATALVTFALLPVHSDHPSTSVSIRHGNQKASDSHPDHKIRKLLRRTSLHGSASLWLIRHMQLLPPQTYRPLPSLPPGFTLTWTSQPCLRSHPTSTLTLFPGEQQALKSQSSCKKYVRSVVFQGCASERLIRDRLPWKWCPFPGDPKSSWPPCSSQDSNLSIFQ